MSNNNGTSHPHTHPNDLAREGQRIQELVDKLSDVHDPAARKMLHELLETTLSFYGHGLERILELIEKAGAGGEKVREALLHDPGVRGLLLIHGLHPISLEQRLTDALDKVRPYMESHGGNVELISLEDDYAKLRLQGHCQTCPSSTVTLELAVRAAIEEGCPDLAGFEVEGMKHDGQPLEHAPNAAPEWSCLETAEEIPNGQFRSIRLEAESLFVCKIEDQLYAYRDHCPACNLPLHLGQLNGDRITCSLGHRFDGRHAGASFDDAPLHLDPVPLLLRDGVVRVALGRQPAEPRSDAESLHHEHTH